MTALAGCWSFGPRDARGDCERMLDAQQRYGPHARGLWPGDDICLGRCLYRLLPEDDYDRQPIVSGQSRRTLVADVRLDNRDELLRALGGDAPHAATAGEAEVLAACLERWGEEGLDRIVGDFAFALWDPSSERLLLARDVLGQRPLHFHRGDGFFAFASMPAGLHALESVPLAPNERRAAEFLALLPEAPPSTFFAGIEIVAPGEIVTVTRVGMSKRRYWQPQRPPARSQRADGAYVDGLREVLDQAVKARLRGRGAAVGAQLSAGLDSSAVTATAARLLAGTATKVFAFTAVPDEGFAAYDRSSRLNDEGPLAAETARRYPNIEHVPVRPRNRSPLTALAHDFSLFSRPSLNPFNMAWIEAINAAAQERGVSIMLIGQMGNMTLSYAGQERLGELRRRGLLPFLREGAMLARAGTTGWGSLAMTALLPLLPPGLRDSIAQRRGPASSVQGQTMLNPAWARELRPGENPPQWDSFDTRLATLTRIDPGNFNKGMLAGWGVDVRDPTADRRLVEYCLGLPMDQFLRDGETRRIARRALADRLPPAVLEERRKGFQAADWSDALTAARPEIDAELERVAACAAAARVLDVERMRRLVDNWPLSGWGSAESIGAYRLGLTRGLAMGHFLRRLGEAAALREAARCSA